MHEGGWEPFVHHFSPMLGGVVLRDEETRISGRRGTTPARREPLLCPGTWCKGNGGTRAGGLSCTNSAPSEGEKAGGTWCKGNGGTRAGGLPCTKSIPAASEKPAQAVEEKARAGRRRPIPGRSCGSL